MIGRRGFITGRQLGWCLMVFCWGFVLGFAACRRVTEPPSYATIRALQQQGWYLRADSLAIGHNFADGSATNWNMRLGESDTRCMCKEGFVVRDDAPDTFIVVSAPYGYDDTVGRRFKTKIDWAVLR